MYKEPRDWGLFLPGVNFFLDQAKADMTSRGRGWMYCPCFDCLNQKKIGQRDNIFHHLITRGSKKDYMCWNMHGEGGLNEDDIGCVIEGESQRHAQGDRRSHHEEEEQSHDETTHDEPNSQGEMTTNELN
jgi:hypothetical protein